MLNWFARVRLWAGALPNSDEVAKIIRAFWERRKMRTGNSMNAIESMTENIGMDPELSH